MSDTREISRYNFKDYTVEGDVDGRGLLEVVDGVEAVRNAIHIWVCSFTGERVRDPGSGGLITRWLFKPLTEDTREEIIIAIRIGLEEEFSPYLKIRRLDVQADTEHMCWRIYLDTWCYEIGEGVVTVETLRALT